MRPLSARIRLDDLRHNYQTLKQIHDGEMFTVIKADAYGYGAVWCAHALSDLTDGFAVATVDETVELRESGITSPIILPEGVSEASEYATVDKYNLRPGAGSQWQLKALIAHSQQTPIKVWLKMDSDVHRVGFFPHNYTSAYATPKQCKHIDDIVKFSHFVCVDEPDNGVTETQLEALDLAYGGLKGEESLANSAAVLNAPEAHRGWGCAGLVLYGTPPFGGVDERLKPVVCLIPRAFGKRVLQPHSPVGYGATFYTSKSTRVGLIVRDYTDGYPHRASTNSPVVVEDKRSRVIGRMPMDMITAELDTSQEGLGAEAELWDDIININEVVEAAGMIPYEIFCNVKCTKFTHSE